MRFNKYLITLFFFSISPIVINAQPPLDVCHITSSARWEKQRGSNYVLGEFRPTAFDELTTKSFIYPDSKLVVTMSVEYTERYSANQKGKPSGIRIALTVSDNAKEDAFDSVDNVVAGTSYKKRWGKLYVEKQISAGEEIYTFVASCEDDSKSNIKRK